VEKFIKAGADTIYWLFPCYLHWFLEKISRILLKGSKHGEVQTAFIDFCQIFSTQFLEKICRIK